MVEALEGEGAACECPPAPACGRHLLLYFARSPLSLRVSGLHASDEVALWLDPPQAEPLREWQAFGQSKGGGDRRRRTAGDICPSACRSRRGPDARDHTCRTRRIAGALEGEGAACECPPAPACGRHLLLYFARSPLSLRVSGLHASVEVALRLDPPHAEPLRGWQAFGHSKGGGDRRRRTAGDICPSACRSRRGPDARDYTGRNRRIAGAQE